MAAFSRNRSQRNGLDPYCKPCFDAIEEKNRQKNHGSSHSHHLRRRYGITVDDFDRMFAEQDGVRHLPRGAGRARRPRPRDAAGAGLLLCFNCNGALGQFRDRADLMLRAVHYLRNGARTGPEEYPDAVVGLYLGPTERCRPHDEPDDGWDEWRCA